MMHCLRPVSGVALGEIEASEASPLLQESSSSEVGSAAQDIEAQIKAREDRARRLESHG